VGAVLGPLISLLTQARLSRGVELNSVDAFNFGVTASTLFVAAEFFDAITYAVLGQPEVQGLFQVIVTVYVVFCIARALLWMRKKRPHRYPVALQFIRDTEPHQVH